MFMCRHTFSTSLDKYQETQLLDHMVRVYFSSVQSFSLLWLFVTPWTVARQASPSITNSRSLLKFLSIESLMPSNHLILCHPLLLLPSIFPSIRVFSNELVLPIRWPKYWGFSFSISPSNEYSDPLGLTSLISLQSKGLLKVFSNTTGQKHQFFGAQLCKKLPNCFPKQLYPFFLDEVTEDTRCWVTFSN